MGLLPILGASFAGYRVRRWGQLSSELRWRGLPSPAQRGRGVGGTSVCFGPRHWLVPFFLSGGDRLRRKEGWAVPRPLAIFGDRGSAVAKVQVLTEGRVSPPRSPPGDVPLRAGVSSHLRPWLEILLRASISPLSLRSVSMGRARILCRERRPPAVTDLLTDTRCIRGVLWCAHSGAAPVARPATSRSSAPRQPSWIAPRPRPI
ncbi:hypothetical protein NDU88_002918 [Pleurodeles waltl]|uniref:Uncharacterized protein n=1 Tax=Pleurodeles waltl TaxID=8319 RepID=A0AAV7PB42_PLEWA|nr:hypothetical protein NDU88_002918 [Pleurodeles waltl]